MSEKKQYVELVSSDQSSGFILYGDKEKYEHLPAKEQIKLVCKYQKTKDEKIKFRIIESNIMYVFNTVNSFKGKGLPMADLVVLGCMGMERAIDKFDKKKKCSFISYASWWIEQYIRRALTSNSSIIRVPDVAWNKMYKIRTLRNEGLTDTEIAKKTGMTLKSIKDSDFHSQVLNVISSSATENEDAPEREYFIEEEKASDKFELADSFETVKNFVDKLPERERAVIKARFALGSDDYKTLQEIAEQFHLSRERIRQIESLALRKLRRMLEKGKHNKR